MAIAWDWAWLPIKYRAVESARMNTQDKESSRNDTFVYDKTETGGIMSTQRLLHWRERLPPTCLRWRRHDSRQLGLFTLVAFTVSLLLFGLHRQVGLSVLHKAISLPYSGSPVTAEPVAENPKVLGVCTTWPDGDSTPNANTHNFTLQSFAPPGGWKKPAGITVKALIFYGRQRTVDFLDCYLQQNLAVNGGYLDEVWFMVHTSIDKDLAYLKKLVGQRGPRYKMILPGKCKGFDFACMWNPVVEDNTIYIKIDDDIIFIHPDTIPQLVSTRVAEPHPLAISANLVNSPFTGYKHYDVGAIHPFAPDWHAGPSHPAAQLWRPSDFSLFSIGKILDGTLYNGAEDKITEQDINKYLFAKPSYQGHPWLLLEDVDHSLLKTPMGINRIRLSSDTAASAYGAAWKSWMVSAQQQYSLLRNLELNTMWRYHFGTRIEYPQGKKSRADAAALKFVDPHYQGPGAEQLYDTQYIRYNLNFVALWGHDIRKSLPIAADDEQDLTVTKPKKFKRPFVIDTRAVVGHLSFFPQHDGIRQTDLLDRWRAFANEMICTANNQKYPLDGRCPGY